MVRHKNEYFPYLCPQETLETLSVEGVNGVVKAFCFYFAYAIAMVCGFAAIRPLREKTSGVSFLE